MEYYYLNLYIYYYTNVHNLFSNLIVYLCYIYIIVILEETDAHESKTM
jgi:hypothetical protein